VLLCRDARAANNQIRTIFIIKSAGVALHGGDPAFFYQRKAKSIT
jgi:hypothetical protein